jgi:transposase
VIGARGPGGITAVIGALHDGQDALPALARAALHGLVSQLRGIESEVEKRSRRDRGEDSQVTSRRRFQSTTGDYPGHWSDHGQRDRGADASPFQSGQQFAAWLGQTLKAHTTGGKERQVGISKQGDGYLRRLLVLGATGGLAVRATEQY